VVISWKDSAMVDRGASPASQLAASPNPSPRSGSQKRHLVTGGKAVWILPNAVAAMVSFLFLMIAQPTASVVLGAFVDVVQLTNDFSSLIFVPVSLLETIFYSVAAALLFMVIGVTLQIWEYHRPFDSRWPVALAFPVAWALLLPEVLVRGGSLLWWILVGIGIGLAFSVHWIAVLVAREAID
jgi:hypothetical protein